MLSAGIAGEKGWKAVTASALGLYWWNPIREPRDLQWLVRRERRTWVRMAAHGSRSLKNFGDELSRKVVTEATGRATTWSAPHKAELFAIGSILEKHAATDSQARIWGSGLRVGEHLPLSIDSRDVLAVRGHETLGRQLLPADLPVGDPGLIARSVYGKQSRRRGTILIPHFLAFGDRANDSVIAAARASGIRVVPPTSAVDEVCGSIGGAELVITSSLHGLIVGHALGTPTILAAFGASAEPGFKYGDYMSVFGRSPRFWSMDDLLKNGFEEARRHAIEECEAVDARVDHIVERLIEAAAVFR